MSVSSYRSTVERLHKELADLEKRRSQKNQKIANLLGEISSIERSITRNTSASTLRSKQRQIETKSKALAQAQEEVADCTKKISTKTGALNHALQQLENAEAQERRKQDAAEKKRRDEELRHAKAVTQEISKQAHLHSQISNSRLVIDMARLPLEIKVVIFAPAPQDLEPLRLDNEIRDISVKLRASEYRDSVKVIPCLATQPLDVLQALNEHQPQVVHFSGHGSQDEIAFVDPEGNSKPVTKGAIVQVMQTTGTIRLVVFNTCLSSEQAEAVTQYIDAAIGMTDEIGDEAARVFAAQFYSSIGFGHSVKVAFEQAKAALMLEGIPEENTPALFTREGVDPETIVLVRPFNITGNIPLTAF